MLIKNLGLYIAMFFCHFAQGQWFKNISTYTTQNGLSNNTVTCLVKDEAGFLWIGTHEGLNRYDGTEFVNILASSRNNIPSNNISRIVIINNHTLAVGTEGGLCLLNTSTMQGTLLNLPYNNKFSATGLRVQDLWYNSQTKELWVATWHGLFLFTEEGILKNKLMAAENEMSGGFFARYLAVDSHNDVFFYSQQKNGFFYPDFKNSDLIPAEKKNRKFTLNAFLKQGYFVRSTQMQMPLIFFVLSKFTATSKDILSYYNPEKDSLVAEQPVINCSDVKLLYNAFSISDTLFLLNSFFGEPMLYNSISKQTTLVSNKPLWFTSWPDGINASFLKDGKNYWVATSKGLIQSSDKDFFLQNDPDFIHVLQKQSGLVSYNSAIYYRQKLWMACMGAGLFFTDTVSKATKKVFSRVTSPVLKKKQISNDILSVGNSLWLGSVYGPAQVNSSDGSLHLINGSNKDSLFDDYARFFLKDSRGNVWSSLPDGICTYKIATSSFTNYKSTYHGGNFPLLNAGSKAEDAHGNIWMAKLDTLVKFNPLRRSFRGCC